MTHTARYINSVAATACNLHSYVTGRRVGQSHLLYGFVDGPERRLLVVVVDAAVAMEDEDSVLLGGSAVAAIDAVVGAIIPLAREHKQTLCGVGREGGVGVWGVAMRQRWSR